MGIAGNYTKYLVREALKGIVVDQTGKPVPINPNFMTIQKNDLPVFPVITLGMKGHLRDDEIGEEQRLYLSVWSKSGQTELWFIYNQVRALLNLNSFPGSEETDFHQIALMREVFTDDNLYNEKTFTFQLATRYKIDYV